MQVPVRVRNLYPQISTKYPEGVGGRGGTQTYSTRIQLPILMLIRPILCPGNINHPVNNNMGDMDALWSELTGQRLGQRAQGELARCKGCEVR